MQSTVRDVAYDTDKSNPHSVIEVWASNFYTRINHLMRNYNPNFIVANTPYAFRFIKQMFAYFDKHGVTKTYLQSKNIKTLYRGIDNKFTITKTYLENGFMSTSWEKHIGVLFSKSSQGCGLLQRYAVDSLPNDIRFIIIDSTIASMYREAEILFMPGSITSNHAKTKSSKPNKNEYILLDCQYLPNVNLIESYKQIPMPKVKRIRGGNANLNCVHIDEVTNKYVVFYRVRYKHPVEIFTKLYIPNNKEDAINVLKTNKKSLDNFYEETMELIPEFVNIRNKLRQITNITPNILDEFKISQGYQVFSALYDHITNTIITIHFMVDPVFFYELFDKSRETDVIEAIQKWTNTELFYG